MENDSNIINISELIGLFFDIDERITTLSENNQIIGSQEFFNVTRNWIPTVRLVLSHFGELNTYKLTVYEKQAFDFFIEECKRMLFDNDELHYFKNFCQSLVSNIEPRVISLINENISQQNELINRLKIESINNNNQIHETLEKTNRYYFDAGLKSFKNLYKAESDNQKITSRIWLLATGIFFAVLVGSIAFCFYINREWVLESEARIFIIANEVTFNLLLLTAVFWCARMYSTSLALSINYNHKAVSSDALSLFISQSKYDDDIKATMLLESSRVVLAPPETGLTQKNNQLNMKLLDTIKDLNLIPNAKKP